MVGFIIKNKPCKQLLVPIILYVSIMNQSTYHRKNRVCLIPSWFLARKLNKIGLLNTQGPAGFYSVFHLGNGFMLWNANYYKVQDSEEMDVDIFFSINKCLDYQVLIVLVHRPTKTRTN